MLPIIVNYMQSFICPVTCKSLVSLYAIYCTPCFLFQGISKKTRKLLLEELPGISESEASGGPLLSAMIKKLKQQQSSFPVQNFTGMHLSKPEDFLSTAPKTESLSGTFNGTSVSVEGKTLGGVKEDFGKVEFPGSDSVRRVLDFNKATTSFPPVGTDMNKKLTSEDTSGVNRYVCVELYCNLYY